MGVSSLSLSDVALIKGSWYYATSDEFQCETHFKLLGERAKTANEMDALLASAAKKRKGCGLGITEDVRISTDDGFSYYGCLCHKGFHHPSFNQLIFLQEAYKRGVLPFPGCITDQPASILEIFSLLENLQLERDIEQRKKQESNQRAASASKKKNRPKTR